MNSQFDPNTEPAPDSVYQTGRTQPPRNHGGLLAVLLIAVIFLCGLSSWLGFLNIHLFRRVMGNEETVPEIAQAWENATASEDVPGQQALNMTLSDSPLSQENRRPESSLSLQEIYQKNIGSVVSVSADREGMTRECSGVILTADGYIATSGSRVRDAESITVLLTAEENELPAVLVGVDTLSDLAVLRVEADNLTPAEFGSSDALRVGDAVAAIGDPLGSQLRGTLADGIVCAINRNVRQGGRELSLIQTNATFGAESVGGPLLNGCGQVVGIRTAALGTTDTIGCAIPSGMVKSIVSELLQKGYVSGSLSLGVIGQTVPLLHQVYGKLPQGVYVTQVDRRGEAGEKSVQAGDVITAINGKKTPDLQSMEELFYEYQAGDTVTVTLSRDGESLDLQMKLEALE